MNNNFKNRFVSIINGSTVVDSIVSQIPVSESIRMAMWALKWEAASVSIFEFYGISVDKAGLRSYDDW